MNFAERVASIGLKSNPTMADLRVFLDTLNPQLYELGPWLAEPDGFAYGRKLIYCDEVFECILMNWDHRVPCAPHDHGPKSFGLVKLLRGGARHTVYRRIGGELKVDSVTEHESPELLEVVPSMLHSMESIGKEAMLSFHVYAPPIHDMKVFDSVTKSVLTVSDQCGAWVPRDSNFIKSRGPF